MKESDRFRINEGEVVAQSFEDEVVMINLAKGLYYSMQGSGAFVWERVVEGQCLTEVTDALTEAYRVSQPQARTDVVAVIDAFLENELIVPRDSGPLQASSHTAVSAAQAYEPPELLVHDDIGHLLALDPPLPDLQQALTTPPPRDD